MAYGAYTEEEIEERIEEMTPKNKKMDIVYFFLCDGFIKIGKVNPNDDEDVADPGNERRVLSRLSGCKTGNPKQIYLLGYLIGEGPNRERPKLTLRENAVEVKIPREQVIFGDIPEFDSTRVADLFYKE